MVGLGIMYETGESEPDSEPVHAMDQGESSVVFGYTGLVKTIEQAEKLGGAAGSVGGALPTLVSAIEQECLSEYKKALQCFIGIKPKS